jgi:phosphatidylglycerophosphate synthase
MTHSAEKHGSNRVQESLLAPYEKVLLIKLASWMPRCVNPDHLTLLGFVSMFLAGLSYWLSDRDPAFLFAASSFIVLNWFGDSLDGTLARYRQRLRPRYGYYVDHMIDAFGTFFLVVGIGLSGFMNLTLSLLLLAVYLMLSIQTYLATNVFEVFRISFWKLSPTEVRILLITGNTFAYYHPDVYLFGSAVGIFDLGAVVAVSGMGAMLIAETVRNTARLYREERPPEE